MKCPEIQARHSVVIARITQVQEPQDVLVDEVEPEEAVIRTRFAVHAEVEIGRIAQGRQDVPGGGNRQQQRETGDGPQSAPVAFGEEQIEQAGSDGKYRCDQSFQQQPDPDARPHGVRPTGRIWLAVLDDTQ